jgi:hypothetical protein
MKKILLLTLPLLLTACAYDVNHYVPVPYGVNVVTPAPRPVYVNHSYQQPKTYYVKPAHNEHHHHDYNEHHDNGKHKGQHKNKHHDD